MVKKIRLVDQPAAKKQESDAKSDSGDFNNELMELLKSMDWKLWEMLQILQRTEKNLSVTDETGAEDGSSNASK